MKKILLKMPQIQDLSNGLSIRQKKGMVLTGNELNDYGALLKATVACYKARITLRCFRLFSFWKRSRLVTCLLKDFKQVNQFS